MRSLIYLMMPIFLVACGNNEPDDPVDLYVKTLVAFCEKEDRIYERFFDKDQGSRQLYEDFRNRIDSSFTFCLELDPDLEREEMIFKDIGRGRYALLGLTVDGDYAPFENYYVRKTDMGYRFALPVSFGEKLELRAISRTKRK